MDHTTFIDHLEVEIGRLNTIASGNLTIAVPSCPGWDLAKLIGHVGRVERMVLGVVPTGAMEPVHPDSLESPPPAPDDLRAYFRTGAARLVAELRSKSPDAPAWNFMGTSPIVAFWSRRQAHEHAVHRWDAESAVGAVTPVDSDLAVDGVDEYFEIANARVLPRKPDFTLGGTVHLHATDAAGEWMLTSTPGGIAVSHAHGKGDAAVRGTASDLLLGLWGRLDLTAHGRFEHFGDHSIVKALATIGGN